MDVQNQTDSSTFIIRFNHQNNAPPIVDAGPNASTPLLSHSAGRSLADQVRVLTRKEAEKIVYEANSCSIWTNRILTVICLVSLIAGVTLAAMEKPVCGACFAVFALSCIGACQGHEEISKMVDQLLSDSAAGKRIIPSHYEIKYPDREPYPYAG
ncbi:MAG: hypothetical protein HY860_04760 [Chlamydiales bacterium]|nr:hypothetical protein [Chlamydiales bacterium]